MKLNIKVEHNEIIPENRDKWEDLLAKVDGLGFFEVNIPGNANEIRTDQQRKAIEVYCREVAGNLNDHGYDFVKTIKEGFAVMWNQNLVKEMLWKGFQKVYTGKESTTQLKKNELDQIIAAIDNVQINRNLDPVPFPGNREEV